VAEAQSKSSGFARTAAKNALAPLAHAAVTAGTAYLTRKAMQLWQEKVQPQLEKKGGRTFAKETLSNVADKAGAVAEPVASLADRMGVPTGEQKSSSSREAERRRRAQRRDQRRRALDKSGSS
jgi:hypothetical protein